MTPIYPLAKTVADINMDSWNIHGRTKDMTLIGYGASDLDDYARDAAAEQGRVVHGDAEPEKGFLLPLRSLQLREAGRARARYRDSGVDYIGKPPEFAQADARGVDREAVPHAARRRDAGLGPDAARARISACCSPSATAWRRRTRCRSGSRATSSRRSETRC